VGGLMLKLKFLTLSPKKFSIKYRDCCFMLIGLVCRACLRSKISRLNRWHNDFLRFSQRLYSLRLNPLPLWERQASHSHLWSRKPMYWNHLFF
jgi:hypothetical protein